MLNLNILSVTYDYNIMIDLIVLSQCVIKKNKTVWFKFMVRY